MENTNKQKVEIEWFHGYNGTGKTRLAKRLLDKKEYHVVLIENLPLTGPTKIYPREVMDSLDEFMEIVKDAIRNESFNSENDRDLKKEDNIKISEDEINGVLKQLGVKNINHKNIFSDKEKYYDSVYKLYTQIIKIEPNDKKTEVLLRSYYDFDDINNKLNKALAKFDIKFVIENTKKAIIYFWFSKTMKILDSFSPDWESASEKIESWIQDTDIPEEFKVTEIYKKISKMSSKQLEDFNLQIFDELDPKGEKISENLFQQLSNNISEKLEKFELPNIDYLKSYLDNLSIKMNCQFEIYNHAIKIKTEFGLSRGQQTLVAFACELSKISNKIPILDSVVETLDVENINNLFAFVQELNIKKVIILSHFRKTFYSDYQINEYAFNAAINEPVNGVSVSITLEMLKKYKMSMKRYWNISHDKTQREKLVNKLEFATYKLIVREVAKLGIISNSKRRAKLSKHNSIGNQIYENSCKFLHWYEDSENELSKQDFNVFGEYSNYFYGWKKLDPISFAKQMLDVINGICALKQLDKDLKEDLLYIWNSILKRLNDEKSGIDIFNHPSDKAIHNFDLHGILELIKKQKNKTT